MGQKIKLRSRKLQPLGMDRLMTWQRILWVSSSLLINLSNSHKLGHRALLNLINNHLNPLKFRDIQEFSLTHLSSMRSGDTLSHLTMEVITINITTTISITTTNTIIHILILTRIPSISNKLPNLSLTLGKIKRNQMEKR